MYSTGNYSQYYIIIYKEKNLKKNVCVCVLFIYLFFIYFYQLEANYITIL